MKRDRVVLVGQAPSRTGDPARPLTGACGQRVAALAGLDFPRSYARVFERANVIDVYPGSRAGNRLERNVAGKTTVKGDHFPQREAKTAASALASRFRGRTVVLLGRAVARAFGLPGDLDFFRFVQHDGMTIAVAPHPSRVSRWWNDPDHEERAARFFSALVSGYVYRGDKLTDHSLVGRTCTAVRDDRGKCIRGRLGTMLVVFEDGTAFNVVARQLRRLTPRAIASTIPERNQQ